MFACVFAYPRNRSVEQRAFSSSDAVLHFHLMKLSTAQQSVSEKLDGRRLMRNITAMVRDWLGGHPPTWPMRGSQASVKGMPMWP